MSKYIIAIDPGSNTGVTIFKVDKQYKILKIENKIFKLNKNKLTYSKDIILNRLLYLTDICNKLYDDYKPEHLFLEAAFMNVRFPKAVMQLSQYIAVIQMSFINKNKNINIKTYPPKYVKKFIGAGGNAKKEDMTKAVSKIKELKKLLSEDLTEHEIDSIAIGYIGISELKKEDN